MTENKKKLRQQHNLRQVFELCGSLRLPCHIALSPVGSGHITADKRFDSCIASPKFSLRENFVYPQNVSGKCKRQHRGENNETTNNIFRTCLFNQLDYLASVVWTYYRLNQFTDFALSSRTWRTRTFNFIVLDNLDFSKERRNKPSS